MASRSPNSRPVRSTRTSGIKLRVTRPMARAECARMPSRVSVDRARVRDNSTSAGAITTQAMITARLSGTLIRKLRAMPSRAEWARVAPKEASRRQTTEQPSGPATTATPRPPIRARQKKSPSTASLMLMVTGSLMAGAGNNVAVQVMLVVMVMMIHRQRFRYLVAEGFDKGRVVGNIRRIAAAADMLVQADHLVGGSHHQVQVVRDHDDAAV